jgi:hypothetical protein
MRALAWSSYAEKMQSKALNGESVQRIVKLLVYKSLEEIERREMTFGQTPKCYADVPSVYPE